VLVIIQHPSVDSSWGRFFRGAELEKTVDQDLSRLYPEDGSYFQTPTCQAMLRRILLMWCLQHPEHGYRQGKELLLHIKFTIVTNFSIRVDRSNLIGSALPVANLNGADIL
jgi:hypothetical protein